MSKGNSDETEIFEEVIPTGDSDPLTEMQNRLKEKKKETNHFNNLSNGENRLTFKSNFIRWDKYNYSETDKETKQLVDKEREVAIFNAVLHYNERDKERKILGINWPIGLSLTAFESLLVTMQVNGISTLIDRSFKVVNTRNRNYKWMPVTVKGDTLD